MVRIDPDDDLPFLQCLGLEALSIAPAGEIDMARQIFGLYFGSAPLVFIKGGRFQFCLADL